MASRRDPTLDAPKRRAQNGTYAQLIVSEPIPSAIKHRVLADHLRIRRAARRYLPIRGSPHGR
jgi:hypothetical protein